MKLATLDNPVLSSWITEQGLRLDPGPYVSDAYQARKFIESLPHVDFLSEVTKRIFHPGIFRRQWTNDPEHGVPFLGSASIFQADLSNLPLITNRSYSKRPQLRLEPGWTLITRSGMTSGRVTYSRLEMDGFACSEDVLRIVASKGIISAGYLYTFLASSFGRAMIKGRVYGTSIKHLEPHHIADIPIPRVDPSVESEIDDKFHASMKLRLQFQEGITEATRDLFDCAGLSELAALDWHDERDLDFSVTTVTPSTLRAFNFSPRSQRIVSKVQSISHKKLGEICATGYLGSGTRFKRIDADEEHGGVRLIGQRQGFWLRPEGRWINPQLAPRKIFAQDESVLVAAQGTLGDNEMFCRPILVTGSWLKYAYTQHFLRIVSGDPEFPGAYLFAFLRSEAMFRVLRSMSTGSKQQDIHEGLRWHIPVPECTPEDRERIAEMVRQAYRWRDEADMKEDEALTLLDQAVREAAR